MGKIKGKKKDSNNKKIKFSKRHPKLVFSIRLILLLIIMTIVIIAGVIGGMLYGMWGDDFEITEEDLAISGNSVILDSDGKVLAELSGDENRKVITLKEMAEYLPKAYIAIEDERFYEHNGVDLKRTSSAIFTFLTHKGDSSYGGSTITQQLVKNITKDDSRSGIEGIKRKIREWSKAYKMEEVLTKDQILELYLNLIYIGGGKNYHGVEVAAEYYFGKTAKELSLVECAFLAGINNTPNSYNPYGEHEYGKDKERTDKIDNRTLTVVQKMVDCGFVTQAQYDEAYKYINSEGLKFKQTNKMGNIYSYHTDATISKVISDLMEAKKWSREYASTYVYGGGLTIYSTQNTKLQKQMEEVFEGNASKYTEISRKNKDEKGNYVKIQSAMTLIDNETGYAVGIIGGLGEKNESRGLNRATQSPRQTGSSIKPIADVLPGLQEGLITTSTMYNDCLTQFPGNFKPKDEGAFRGIINLRSALITSQNVPFVKVMAEVTNPVATSYLKKMGITTLDKNNDTSLSLALGGLTNGISTFEMAAAYATIENDGVYREPLLYTKITDSKGNKVIEPEQKTETVCSKENAFILKDLLKSVVEFGCTYCRIPGMDVAAKTGTTNDNYDRWLCGFTNYYTAATWYGYDKNETVRRTGYNPAGLIFSEVMTKLHKDKKNSRFERPDGIVNIKVCSNTGLRATSDCKKTHNEIFVKGHIPDECDEKGSAVEICESSGKLATEFCPKVVTEYLSYTIPKERLGLWTNLSNTGSKKITEKCKEHTAKNSLDNALPTIKLKGKEKMKLKIGEEYVEPGASASDKTDGDLTNQIIMSGSVNTNRAGTYTISYKVTNSKKYSVTKERTVIVGEEKTVEKPTQTETSKPSDSSTSTPEPTKKETVTPTKAVEQTPEPTKAVEKAPEPTKASEPVVQEQEEKKEEEKKVEEKNDDDKNE